MNHNDVDGYDFADGNHSVDKERVTGKTDFFVGVEHKLFNHRCSFK